MNAAHAIGLCVLLLSGCSQTCNPGSVVGSYGLVVGGTSYRIDLQSGGNGSLLVGDRNTGNFRWTLTQGDQQSVELDATGDVYAALRGLTTFAPSSTGIRAPTQGVISLPSECHFGRTLQTLLINSDRDLVFSRVRGKQ